MEKKPTVIDLFCGIGGFSKGFEMAGFKVVLGIDNWEVALNTFEANHDNTKVINEDIREVSDEFFKQYKETDVIIAGPPCQGFSMCGTRNINDDRNNLFREVLRAVKNVNPKIVVIENVVGLMSMKTPEGLEVKEIIISELEKQGYEVENQILDASDYYVPQSRKRVFFIGSKIGKVGFPNKKSKKFSVSDALSNIPNTNEDKYLAPENKFQNFMANNHDGIIHNHEAMRHNKDVIRRIENVPPGGNWKDIPPEIYNVGGNHSNNYRRLHPNKPAITIKHATKSMIIHYEHDRVITAREAGRLQSFPDSFVIKGNRSDQQQQLANAVPPLLGFAIGKQIIDRIDGKKQKIEYQSNLFN